MFSFFCLFFKVFYCSRLIPILPFPSQKSCHCTLKILHNQCWGKKVSLWAPNGWYVYPVCQFVTANWFLCLYFSLGGSCCAVPVKIWSSVCAIVCICFFILSINLKLKKVLCEGIFVRMLFLY